MNIRQRKAVCVAGILVIGLFIAGCGQPVGAGKGTKLVPKVDLGTTIGSLTEVFSFGTIPVEGYNLVGGLRGTGSAQCPPQIRTYLEKYILRKLSGQKDVGKFISSPDTAVVLVHGFMPAAVSKNQHFDVRVVALPGTQTTSLEGGWLYGAELKEAGRFGMATKVLATAEGPVFIDTISTSETNKKVGYVLAGGTVLDEYRIILALRQPDYRIASRIRNRLNERFGADIARAVSPSHVELRVPAKYAEQKQRFVSLIRATYLAETPEITKKRISTFVRRLAVSQDKFTSEIALEAIGNESLDKLTALLGSSYEQVRLRTARCMLNLGSDRGRGLQVLWEIAMDKGSAYRVEALEAIIAAASRNAAAAVSRKLLGDEDFDIRLAAYENLRKLDDIAVAQELIARKFYLEQIAQTSRKAIFVSRSGQPRIVLFGAPIYCRDNVFAQSADGNITINAPAGQKYASIIRKHPKRPNVTVQLKSSLELADIIRTLCEEPPGKTDQGSRGLDVSYADVIALLKRMCDKGAVQAEFVAGPLPGFPSAVFRGRGPIKIGPIIKKRQTAGR